MNIQDILNPDPRAYSQSPRLARNAEPSGPPSKRQKVLKLKDEPTYTEGKQTVGIVNYPIYDAGDNRAVAAGHRRFHIKKNITVDAVGQVPYNSGKRDFSEKTGRYSFEVFQYKYINAAISGDKEWHVLWDYNVGLVRMTPFFKSLGHQKTTPAKALKENPGLAEISYSITGGALAGQGYWVPYQAAKALAATFCYDIRWALTPVFGNDFPSLCIKPGHANYQKYLISPEIVRFCARETERFRREGASYQLWSPSCLYAPTTTTTTPTTGEASTYNSNSTSSTRPHFDTPNWNSLKTDEHNHTNSSSSSFFHTTSRNPRSLLASPPARPISTYYSDPLSGHNDPTTFFTPPPPPPASISTTSPSNAPKHPSFSPQISPRSTTTALTTSTASSPWTPINGSQSPASPMFARAPTATTITTTTTTSTPPTTTSTSSLAGSPPRAQQRQLRRKRAHVPTSAPAAPPGRAQKRRKVAQMSVREWEEESDDDVCAEFVAREVRRSFAAVFGRGVNAARAPSSSSSSRGRRGRGGRGCRRSHTVEDVEAAEAMMLLNAADRSLLEEEEEEGGEEEE